MTEDKLHILIEKYSNGTASEEELLLLEKVLAKAEKNVIDSSFSDFDRAETKERIFNAIKTKTKRHQFNYVFKIAASILVILGIASFMMFQNFSTPIDNVVYNDTGAPKYIYLPDSSKVILNINSELKYTDEFNKYTREIVLNGEANFSVTSNKSKPFIVHTKHISTKVLGTEFNIKENDGHTSVTVTEGLVRVSSESDSLKLLPNQQVVFSSKSKQLEKKEVTASHFNLWYKDEINLKNLSLYEIAEILENLYNTNIHFENENDKNIKMSISFNRKEDLNQIIKRINFVNKVKFKKKANEIIVK